MIYSMLLLSSKYLYETNVTGMSQIRFKVYKLWFFFPNKLGANIKQK
jgi:hypothetical protein